MNVTEWILKNWRIDRASGMVLCFSILFFCLASCADAQSPPWNPPVFDALPAGRSLKLTVESIPIAPSGSAVALGDALADRVALTLKKTEPKLILLSVSAPITTRTDAIVQAVSARFPNAIVLGISADVNFTHRLDNDQPIASAWVVGGGNLKVSAILADPDLEPFDSESSYAHSVHDRLLKTTHDKALFLLSAFPARKTNGVVRELAKLEGSRVPVVVLAASGAQPTIYFAGRRCRNALAAFVVSGTVAIDVVPVANVQAKALADKKTALEEAGLACEAAIVCPPKSSDCTTFKKTIQKHIGKLTPVLGASANDSGQAILFSTPR
ncbi:MAG: hypothetical protein IJQ39_11745 [Thermoguttaceae bacterium]|nr:hypothetical protein [Thermoguttaceae bacterium]